MPRKIVKSLLHQHVSAHSPTAQVDELESSESDGVDEIPAKPAILKDATPNEAAGEEDEEGSDEEQFVVEAIVDHEFDKKGKLKYLVRWAGFPKEEDMTWEPLSNLETAPDPIKEYKAIIGGTPEPETKKKAGKGGSAKKTAKRGASEAFDSPAPASSAKKAKGGRKSDTNGVAAKPEREYPAGLWETEVMQVASIVEDSVKNIVKGKAGKETSMLYGLLEWHDGHRSQHPLRTLRTKCPQKLLDYYEQHL